MKKSVLTMIMLILVTVSTCVSAEDNVKYADEYFLMSGEIHNLRNNRGIEIYFDADVNLASLKNNIFVSSNDSGNGNRIDVYIRANSNVISLTPVYVWPEGEVYIFVKEDICDVNGNRLGQNLKYKLNVRGSVYDK